MCHKKEQAVWLGGMGQQGGCAIRVGKHDEELRPPCKAWKGYLTPFLRISVKIENTVLVYSQGLDMATYSHGGNGQKPCPDLP